MDFETYTKESARTAAGEFHQEIVGPFLLKEVLSNALRTVNIVDQAKKAIFYGKPIQKESLDFKGSSRPIDPSLVDPDLLHAAMGVLTEAAEILEALQDAMEGTSLDRVNLLEELGDIEWYMAMFYRALKTTPDHVREANIAKLRVRYPGKFTEEEAIDRNTDRERSVLESAQGKKVRVLHILGQKSWHDEARISGNRKALLILSETIRLAAWNDEDMSCGPFYPSDGEAYDVVVEPVTEEDFKKRSVHYCDHHDPERNLLPDDITRAVVLSENAEKEETEIRIYEGIEGGYPTHKISRTLSGPKEKAAVLLDVLMRDFGSQTEEDMQKYGKGAFLTLVHLVRGILDDYYPSSVFNGSSGDPGPVFIQKIREAIEQLENRETQ